MNFASRIDFAALMQPVSLKLWGEPNENLSKFPHDVRWGTHGSRHADWEAGTFFNHEKQVGGGVLVSSRTRQLKRHRLGR